MKLKLQMVFEELCRKLEGWNLQYYGEEHGIFDFYNEEEPSSNAILTMVLDNGKIYLADDVEYDIGNEVGNSITLKEYEEKLRGNN